MNNIRKKLTKTELHKVRLDYLKRSFEHHDWNSYQSFFADKNVEIRLERFKGHESDWYGYACTDCGERCIAINESLFDDIDASKPKNRPALMHDIDETLRHEMLHLFIHYCAPRGLDTWGDRCKTFKELEKHYCRKA